MRSARSGAAFLPAARSAPIRQLQQPCAHLHPRPRTEAVALAPLTDRHFHSSPCQQKPNRKPKHKNITVASMQKLAEQNAQSYKAYTEEELADLRKRYSPKQMAAIEAAEAAIPASDLATKAKMRRDPLQFQYLDDFSRIEPTIDFKLSKIRGEGQDYENVLDFAEVPNAAGILGDVEAAVAASEAKGGWEVNDEVILNDETGMPEASEESSSTSADGYNDPAIVFDQDPNITIGHQLVYNDPEYDAALEDPKNKNKEDVTRDFLKKRKQELIKRDPPPYNRFEDPLEAQIDKILDVDSPDVAPDIPRIEDPAVRFGPIEEESDGTSGAESDATIALNRVAKVMGQTPDELRKYRTKTLVHRRVVNQTRLGKISSEYYLVVAGNGNGLVGIGEGKAGESDEAQRVAQLNAIRNMVPILRYEGRTIYGEVIGKSGAVEVRLNARQPGYGVRCSEKIFEIARCAGLADLQAKVTRKARNPMNVAKAVWQALRSQRDPDEVARGRGKKLVDVRKVYYSALV